MKRQNNLVQSNITQMPERGPAETDITNFAEKEFKIEVITMLMELQRNMEELQDEVWREIKEMKQAMEGVKSRLDEVQGTVNG